LPDANQVPRRVAEARDAEVSFGSGRFRHLSTVLRGQPNNFFDIVDVNIMKHSGITRNGPARDESPDEVARGVGKFNLAGIAIHDAPVKKRFIKRSRLLRIDRGDFQIGDATVPGEMRIDAGSRRIGFRFHGMPAYRRMRRKTSAVNSVTPHANNAATHWIQTGKRTNRRRR